MPYAPICYWFPSSLNVPDEYAWRFAVNGEFGGIIGRNATGPVDDKRGALVAPPAREMGTVPTYLPAIQRWDDVGGAWIGVLRDVDPAVLIREKTVPGYWVTMADEQRWLIPVANPFVATCTLPRWDVKGPDGAWHMEVKDQFADVSSRAADTATAMREAVLERKQAAATIGDDFARQLIADAIRINYDVTIEELSALRVFSPESSADAIKAIVDWTEIERVIVALLGAEGGLDGAPFGPGETPDSSGT